MTATVTTIASETVEQFVKRHRNGVFTNDVANRFGMYGKDALKVLKALETAGSIYSERETAGGCSAGFLGAGLVWRST